MDTRINNALGTGYCVVDLGCGSGQLLNSLAAQFEYRVGLDVSRRRLELADNKVDGWRFQEANLNTRFPLEDDSVDAVIANQVIEHIVDPWHFASEIYRALRPDGRYVITTPNIRYLKNIAAILLSGYGPRTSTEGKVLDGWWDDGHLHYFTHRDLRELFSQVGFRQVNCRALFGLEGDSRLRHWLNRRADVYPIREFLSGNILLWGAK